MKLRPSPGSPAALWLRAALTVGWVIVWSGVAWGEWQDSYLERDLQAHGRGTTATVLVAGAAGEFKLGYCRQLLQVDSPIGGVLRVSATRPCVRPWAPGDAVAIFLDPSRPQRVVAADELQGWVSTDVLPVLVATLAAVIAGYPLGRLLLAWERRRNGWAEPGSYQGEPDPWQERIINE